MGTPYGYTPPGGAQVRFDVFGQAWQLVSQRLGNWIAIALVYLIVAGLAGVVLANIPLIGHLAAAAIGGLLMGGLYRAAFRQLRGEEPQVADMFQIGDIAGPLIVAGLLETIGTAIAAALCLLPGLIVAGLWLFAVPMVADRGVEGITALRESWNTLRGQWPMATVFVLVFGLIQGAGAILCGVGLLVTFPVGIMAIALLYRDFFP